MYIFRLNRLLKIILIFVILLLSSKSVSADSQIYWGAWAGGAQYGFGNAPFDMRALDNFETNAGKKVSVLRWGASWYANGATQPFQTGTMNNVRLRGAIPLLDWGAWDRAFSATNQPAFKHSEIYNGRYDTFIRQWADSAAAWGYPFFLRFQPELNGWWYLHAEGRTASGGIVNGNSVGDLKKAWIHVWRVFNCVDDGVFHPAPGCVPVTNASWVWSINIQTDSYDEYAAGVGPSYPQLSQIYPGNQYVDWLGISLYNKSNPHTPFKTLLTAEGASYLRNTYTDLVNIAPSKPIMLAEYGSHEFYCDGTVIKPGDTTTKTKCPNLKSEWITDALAAKISTYPQIKAAMWYNTTNEFGDPGSVIESSTLATTAFRNAIDSPYYFAGGNPGPLVNLPKMTKVPLAQTFVVSPTPTPTPVVTPTPTSTPVSGQTLSIGFKLQGINTSGKAREFDISLKDSSGNIKTVFGVDMVSDANGVFRPTAPIMLPNVPSGTHEVFTKDFARLKKRLGTMQIGSGNNTAPSSFDSQVVLAGDFNNDNILSIQDTAQFLGKYTATSVPINGTNSRYDVDLNGRIEPADFDIIIVNFSKLLNPGE